MSNSNIWYGGINQTMVKILCSLMGLLVVVMISAFASTTLNGMDVSLKSATGVSISQHKSSLFTGHLLQSHDSESHDVESNFITSQRKQHLVKRTINRSNYFAYQGYGKRNILSVDRRYVSPLHLRGFSHAMELSFGTPVKVNHVLIDTASDLTWVQCIPGQEWIEQEDPYFKWDGSSSFDSLSSNDPLCKYFLKSPRVGPKPKECLYKQDYADGARSEGVLAYENFTFIDDHTNTKVIHRLVFGCGRKNKGALNGAAGVMGLGHGPLSLVSQLELRVFSYCLRQIGGNRDITSPLYLGSDGDVTMRHTPFLQNRVFPYRYYLNLTGISVNDIPVKIPADTFKINKRGRGAVIIDSATTFSHLPSAAYDPFEKAVDAHLPFKRIRVPFRRSKRKMFKLCYNYEGQDGIMCLAFQRERRGKSTVIGSVQHQRHQVAYYIEDSKLGFSTEKQC